MDDDLWSDIEDETLLNLPDESKVSDGEQKCKTWYGTPLQELRSNYLWVTDLVQQNWCEQQMVYKLTLPTVKIEDQAIIEGSNLHLARELEVQDVVRVKITSDEDIWAVKTMNIVSAIDSLLLNSPVRREIPVFGAPFGSDVFILGMIDEIRVDPETFSFDILEFKTRSTSRSLPSKPQRVTHELQVMLYKKMFDDLVAGVTTKDTVVKHINLNLEKQFGADVLSHCKMHGLHAENLNELLDHMFNRMKSVPFISQLLIEYGYQADKSTIAIEPVAYNEKWLREKLENCFRYWKGQRSEVGVEIEEAWKCSKCDFDDVCTWRKKKAEECALKNKGNMLTV